MYGSNGRQRFIKPEARIIKDAYAWETRAQYRGPVWDGDTDVDITLYFPNHRRRDSDNAIKTVFDALTGIVLKDDSQITDHHVHKRVDAVNPRVELIITPL